MKLWPSSARWPALVLLVWLAGLSLAACQAGTDIPWATVEATTAGGTRTPDSRDASATAPVTPTASITPRPTLVLKGQTVEFWHPYQGDLAEQVNRAVTEFNLTNQWRITVRARPFYSSGALGDAVEAGFKDEASGLPHVMAAASEQLAVWAGRDGDGGGIAALDDYVADPQYGFSAEERNAFYPQFWAQDQAGGKQIGIPALRSARVMFYNEGWAKELGFSGPPKTPAEFKTQACAAAVKNNTSKVVDKYGTGGWIIDNDSLTTLSWLSAFGAQPVPAEAGEAYTFDTKEGEAAWTFLRGMLNDGCAWLARDPSPYDYFTKRMALFYSGTLLDLQHLSHWQEKNNNADSWRILPFMGKDGKPLLYSSGYSYAVFAGEPEAEMAAWLFIRWMEDPKVAVRFIKILPSLPVSSAQTAQLADVKSQYPWNMILPMAEAARPAPALESWPAARRLFEDATWQLYHSTPEEVPQILPYLDEALQELSSAP